MATLKGFEVGESTHIGPGQNGQAVDTGSFQMAPRGKMSGLC